MVRTALLVAAGFAVAMGAAAWLAPPWSEEGVTRGADPDALARRLASLESSLREEMDQRLRLELEILALRDEIGELRDAAVVPASVPAEPPPDRRARAAQAGEDEAPARPVRQRRADRLAAMGIARTGRRIERLVDAGFSPERAEWIQQRTEELRMEALQAQHQAARDGVPAGERGTVSAERLLRQELGDAEYEDYLEALSRPTSVPVRQVLSGSPAADSGLQPGDRIVAYAGQRVFSMADLNQATLEGVPGQSVAVDVLRDGQRVQVYVPRGPVGIVGGGRAVRRP